MTQTLTTPTMFRTWGKDRLSDPWITYESRFRWQAEAWIAQRAFALRNWSGAPLISEVAAEGRSCIQMRINGNWQPYTAWEGPEARTRQISWIRAEAARSARAFRIVLEDEPEAIVHV